MNYNESNQGYCQGKLVEPVGLIETRLRQAANDTLYKTVIFNLLRCQPELKTFYECLRLTTFII